MHECITLTQATWIETYTGFYLCKNRYTCNISVLFATKTSSVQSKQMFILIHQSDLTFVLMVTGLTMKWMLMMSEYNGHVWVDGRWQLKSLYNGSLPAPDWRSMVESNQFWLYYLRRVRKPCWGFGKCGYQCDYSMKLEPSLCINGQTDLVVVVMRWVGQTKPQQEPSGLSWRLQQPSPPTVVLSGGLGQRVESRPLL